MRRLPLLALLLLAACGSSGQPDYCPEVYCAVDCGGLGQKVDDDGCLSCACNDKPVSCAGLSEDACNAQPNCAPRYWEAGPQYGLPRYWGCHARQNQDVCPAVACDNVCPDGRVRDANGCETCSCQNIQPPCEAQCSNYCPYGYVSDSKRCGSCECAQPLEPPTCTLYCAYGFQHTETGVEVCACNPEPVCPALGCDPYCPNGIAKDANGCDTCSCASADGGV